MRRPSASAMIAHFDETRAAIGRAKLRLPGYGSRRDAASRSQPARSTTVRHRVELPQIVAQTYQGPLLLHGHEATAQELSEAARLFDLPEDGFHNRLAARVERPTTVTRQLARHSLAHAEPGRRPPARGHGRRVAMLLARRGDESLEPLR